MTEVVAWPQDRTCPYDPAEGYRSLRENRPLGRIRLYDGREAWLVTGHAVGRRLLNDPRISSDQQHPNFPFPAPRFAGSQEFRTPLLGVDGADHKVHRRGLIPSFSYKRVSSLRPHIQETVDGCVDRMLEKGPPADITEDLAVAVSSQTVCSLLGVPYDENEFFKDRVYRVLRSSSNEEAQDASIQLQKYLGELFDRKEAEKTTGDLLSDLLEDQARNNTIPRHELIGIVVLLLLAGYDTTASMISLSTFTLLQHPEQLAQLRADPSLMPTAVEELLRFQSVAEGVLRVATGDIEIGAQTIRADDPVVFSNSLMNRDGEMYPSPDELSWSRSARHHFAFGHGIHQCVGQNLARAEIEISLRTLFERIPDIRLALPADEVPMPPADTVQGPVELLVTW
ncbi:cytochrome P450 [Micromonospora sp. NPDC002296]|uniref:cytochrome P450 n=1 Tax=Micromonospora sp. NPDC002296 TaxID=3154271 RepID=UPI00331BC3FB